MMCSNIRVICKPVTRLGHQEGRRVFREGPRFFLLCPTHLSRGGENFSRGGSPLGCWPGDIHVLPMRFSTLCTTAHNFNKTQLIFSTILLCLFTSKYDFCTSRLKASTASKNKFKYINL